MRKGKILLLLWIYTLTTTYLLVVVASSEKHSRHTAHKRQQLGFHPLHFAAVGLPLRDTAFNGNGATSPGKTGAFKIDDGGVVGAGTYEVEPDGVDIDLSMKISTNGQGAAGEEPRAGGGPAAGGGPGAGGEPGAGGGQGAGGGPRTPNPTVPPKPALCPVPCSQTKPTQGPGGGPTVATSPGGIGASSAPTSVPSQGPGGVAQPTTPGEVNTAPPTSGGLGQTGASSFEEEALKTHNKYRKVHGVPIMKLNAEMSRKAAEYAQTIANQGGLNHASATERNNDGENLSMGCDSDGQTSAEATTNWYNEVCDPGYTFGQPDGSPGTGHFTQVVWKESVELGIGKADVDKNGMKCTYIVGRYRPAGNMGGTYDQNVPKGSFNQARACAGVRRATILKYLAPRSIKYSEKKKRKENT